MLPSVDVGQETQKTVLGWDIKITPEGEPKIIEFHEGSFGIKGFNGAFRHGSIGSQVEKYQGDQYSLDEEYENPLVQALLPELLKTGFQDYLREHSRKDKMHEVLDEFMPELIDPYNPEDLDGEIAISKPPNGGRGEDIQAVDTLEEINFREKRPVPRRVGDRFNIYERIIDRIAERFVESKDIYVGSEPYDGCMRYAIGVEVVEDGVVMEDFGGYWRTAAEPKDAEVEDLKEKYLANYDAGETVEASDEELITAQNTAVEAVSELYRNWLEEEKGHDGVEIDIREL